MTPFDLVHQAWASVGQAGELNRVVEQLAREGVSQAVLDDALGRLLDRVRADGGGEDQEEIIASVGDRLHGWCHVSRVIDCQSPVAPVPRPAAAEVQPYSPGLAK